MWVLIFETSLFIRLPSPSVCHLLSSSFSWYSQSFFLFFSFSLSVCLSLSLCPLADICLHTSPLVYSLLFSRFSFPLSLLFLPLPTIAHSQLVVLSFRLCRQQLDVAIDGADEVSSGLNCIKVRVGVIQAQVAYSPWCRFQRRPLTIALLVFHATRPVPRPMTTSCRCYLSPSSYNLVLILLHLRSYHLQPLAPHHCTLSLAFAIIRLIAIVPFLAFTIMPCQSHPLCLIITVFLLFVP